MSFDFLLRLLGLRKPKSAYTLPLLIKRSIFSMRGFAGGVESMAFLEIFVVADGMFQAPFLEMASMQNYFYRSSTGAALQPFLTRNAHRY
jgi:hypothetical protein